MKHLFFLSDCCFTKISIKNLFDSNKDIFVHLVSDYRDIILNLNLHQSTIENSIIIIDVSSRTPKYRVKQTINAWNICCLVNYYDALKKTSILFYGNHIGAGISPVLQISPKCSLEFFYFKIKQILNNQNNYPMLGNVAMKRLSKKQKILLSRLIYGDNINEIANFMNTQPRNISYARNRIISKFGLHSKYDLAYVDLNILF